jgi:hypothetical protein
VVDTGVEPKPETRNPKPETRNPKGLSQSRAVSPCCLCMTGVLVKAWESEGMCQIKIWDETCVHACKGDRPTCVQV